MKDVIKETLRLVGISVFGGVGVWGLASCGYSLITHGIGINAILPLTFVLIPLVPFFFVAYLCFCRNYRQLYNVLGVVSSIIVFTELVRLQQRWHIARFCNPGLPVLANELDVCVAAIRFLVGGICVFAPFIAANWVYRVCSRLAQRPTKQ